MTNKRIHLIYSIVLSAVLVLAGLLLILACIGIYASGDRPFSTESVAKAFSGIAIPVYLCLALVLGGFILDLVLPLPIEKCKPGKQDAAILRRLLDSLDRDSCYKDVLRQIDRLEKSRRRVRLISILVLTVCSIVFLWYGLNMNNFHQSDINSSMVKAMAVFLPCLAIPFGFAVFNAMYRKNSIQKEIALLKQAPKKAVPDPQQQKPSAWKAVPVLRLALLAVCIGFLLYGFFSGGTQDVLTKAVNICTECVGLG